MPDPIVIQATVKNDGVSYELELESLRRLHMKYPTVRKAPFVFIGHRTHSDFREWHGPMFGLVVQILTGMTTGSLREDGDILFRDTYSGKEYLA